MYLKPLFAAVSLCILAGSALAETRSITDDLGRTIEVPADPQRVAVLHDRSLTTPLIELGVIPVGSHGRTTPDGKPFIRGSIILTGYDFDNSDIAYLGGRPVDIEAVAAVKPDLIITSTWQNTNLDQLSAIAPTVVVDKDKNGAFGVFPLLAKVTSTEDVLARLETRYQAQIKQIRRLIATEEITVNKFQAAKGGFYVLNTYFTLGKVLRDAGFRFPARIDAIPEGSPYEILSPESMQELDADVLFMSYRTDRNQTPQDALDAIEAIVPGWCDLMHACREGQLVILPRAEAISASYDALMALSMTVLAALSSNEIVKKPD